MKILIALPHPTLSGMTQHTYLITSSIQPMIFTVASLLSIFSIPLHVFVCA